MIDPKLLRQSAAEVAANLARRGFEFDTDAYLALEERRQPGIVHQRCAERCRRRVEIEHFAYTLHDRENLCRFDTVQRQQDLLPRRVVPAFDDAGDARDRDGSQVAAVDHLFDARGCPASQEIEQPVPVERLAATQAHRQRGTRIESVVVVAPQFTWRAAVGLAKCIVESPHAAEP